MASTRRETDLCNDIRQKQRAVEDAYKAVGAGKPKAMDAYNKANSALPTMSFIASPPASRQTSIESTCVGRRHNQRGRSWQRNSDSKSGSIAGSHPKCMTACSGSPIETRGRSALLSAG